MPSVGADSISARPGSNSAPGRLPTVWEGSLRPAGEATTNKQVRTIRFFWSFFAKKEPKKFQN